MPFIDHFDLLAPLYERIFSSPNSERLFSFLDLPLDGSLLDAGGGTGRVVKSLSDKVPTIVVVDLSLGMLRVASTKNGIYPVCGQAEALPFIGETFDRIIMVDALHHVYDQSETAVELWRMLKPGGRLVIEEPDVQNFSVKLIAIFEKIVLMRSHFLSPGQIGNLFKRFNANIHIERDGVNAWVIVDKG